MKPLYYRNAKRNLWSSIKPWFSLNYWAYLIIRRNARKSGKSYAVISLPAAEAHVMTQEITEEDDNKAVIATVPPVFQRPASSPHAAEATHNAVQDYFGAKEKSVDAQLMRDRVQEHMAAKHVAPGEIAMRIAERVRAQRLRQK